MECLIPVLFRRSLLADLEKKGDKDPALQTDSDVVHLLAINELFDLRFELD